MAKDFYLKSAKAQMQAIATQRAEALAQLEAAKASDDKWAAAASVQEIANLAAAQENLGRLVNQYVQSQQPPPPESAEMKEAKPLSQMNYADAYELAQRGSKYGIDPDAFRAGIAEVQRRRARGE